MSFLPFAHALASRQDLPVPAWLFAWAASIVLIVSFFALSAAWRKPQFEDERRRPLGERLSAGAAEPAGADPLRRDRRLPPRLRRSTPACAAPKRPTATSPSPSSSSPAGSASPSSRRSSATSSGPSTPGARSAARREAASTRSPASAPRTCATRSGWAAGRRRSACSPSSGSRSSTAAAAASPSASRPTPSPTAALLYSAYTLAMMAVFGVETWCQRGEVFSVYFGMFGRLGIFGSRRVGTAGPPPALLRGHAAGRRSPARPPSSSPRSPAPASTAPRRAPSRRAIEKVFGWFAEAGTCLTAVRATDTIFMLLTFAGVGAIYLLGVRGMRDRPRRPRLRQAPRRLRPHPDPDRPRLPGRPLLQPLRLPGAGPVRLPALRPARHRPHRPLRHRHRRHRLTTSSAPTPSGTSRSAPSSSAT